MNFLQKRYFIRLSTLNQQFYFPNSTFKYFSNEVKKAQTATESDEPTIFDKIISKQIKANIIFEDDKAIAFRDVSPQAPIHFLVIPKVKAELSMLQKMQEKHKDLVGHLLYVSSQVAKQEGLNEDGYRVVINNGKNGSQSVYHLHIHVMGGRQMGWPPG